jgi:hypothetical protein
LKNIVALIIISFLTVPMQGNNLINPSLETFILLPTDFLVDFSLKTIRSDINSRSRDYYMTGSFTVIKTPTEWGGVIARTVDISFRNSAIIAAIWKGKDYIQVNAQATRNDCNSLNELRVYIYQDDGYEGKIDVRKIKVNWKTGTIEVINKLANVSVISQENSILIIGALQKNGYTIGVSLASAKRKRLSEQILTTE